MSTRRTKVPDRLALLDRLPEVAHVTHDGRHRLLQVLNEVSIPAGTVVLDGGHRVGHLYLIGTGTVGATTAEGTLVLHGPSQPVGLRQLLDDTVLPGPIVAVTDAELWTMSRAQFVAACKDVPGFALGLLESAV
jgi:CRP-like cAMP-binding protein